MLLQRPLVAKIGGNSYMNDDVLPGVPFAWCQPPDGGEARAFVQARLVSGESFGKPGKREGFGGQPVQFESGF